MLNHISHSLSKQTPIALQLIVILGTLKFTLSSSIDPFSVVKNDFHIQYTHDLDDYIKFEDNVVSYRYFRGILNHFYGF